MKKSITTLAAFVLGIHALSAQVITNASFENWTTSGSVVSPDNWTTSNGIVSMLGGTAPAVTKESSIVQDGTASAKLTSTKVTSPLGTIVVPGVIGIVNINALTQTYAPGRVFTDRPDSLVGYYQYAPQPGDAFGVLVLLSKWSGSKRDTIGIAELTDNTAHSSFKRFSVPLDYKSTASPDSIMLVFASSSNLTAAVEGSIAYVDNVSFANAGTTSVREVFSTNQLRIAPNPSKGTFQILNAQDGGAVNVFDQLGKKVAEYYISSSNASVNIDQLAKGMYLLEYKGFLGKIIKE